jgi:hypothetical protein
MTPDERKMLSDLAQKFAQTPAPPKDPEAEEFIRTHIGNRPDALYMMTQAVLVQNLALQQAQQQLQALQRGGGTAGSSSGSFLGQSGSQSGPGFSQSSGQGQYAAPPPQYAQASTPSPSSGSAPSFLRGAAQTAAGVAAGALAFEGIRSLFSHPGYGMGSAGLGGFGGGYGFGGGAPADETIVNNYYDNAGGGGGDAGSGLDLQDNRDNLSDAGQFDNTDYSNDSSGFDSSDLGGGFDDGGDNFS